MDTALALIIGIVLGAVLCALVLARRSTPVVQDSAEVNALLRELLHETTEPPAVQSDPDRVWVRFVGQDGQTVAQKRLFRRSIHSVMPWAGASYAAVEEDGDVLVYQIQQESR